MRLRCSSWSQLVSIYRRDLARGRLFLKTRQPLPLGTTVVVKLLLPSGAALELRGEITERAAEDHPRGPGFIVGLDELPAPARLSLESAVRTATEHAERRGEPAASETAPPPSADEGAPVVEAERELIEALETELATYRRLNPFQILGLGYRADTRAVHAAFAELSRRFHPDRFVRYQSEEVTTLAEALFVTARDAYRSLATADQRAATLEAIRAERAPPAVRSLDPLGADPEALELINAGRYDQAIELFYRAARDPAHRDAARIGVELASGMRALALGDRLGAVERFVIVLERDPENEIAARELAQLRTSHSSERQSQLARLIATTGEES